MAKSVQYMPSKNLIPTHETVSVSLTEQLFIPSGMFNVMKAEKHTRHTKQVVLDGKKCTVRLYCGKTYERLSVVDPSGDILMSIDQRATDKRLVIRKKFTKAEERSFYDFFPQVIKAKRKETPVVTLAPNTTAVCTG